jgi:hypothetical protein
LPSTCCISPERGKQNIREAPPIFIFHQFNDQKIENHLEKKVDGRSFEYVCTEDVEFSGHIFLKYTFS